MNTKAAVEVVDLVKTYTRTRPPVRAINQLSFSVSHGEVFSIVGPNGSGKTTTFNIFAYLTTPENGFVSVLDLRPGLPEYFSNIAFVSCETQYLWMLTADEILSFYCSLHGVKKQFKEELIERFGFLHLLMRRWSQLSTGEKMKLRLLKALLKRPRVLFLDEPTAGLDPDAADQFRTKLKGLVKEGVTIILTSHLMRDVEELADRVLFLKAGEVVCEGAPQDFINISSRVDVKLVKCPESMPPFLIAQPDGYFRVEVRDIAKLLEFSEIKEIRSDDTGLEEFFIEKAREIAGTKGR